jgi:hypothetical protein
MTHQVYLPDDVWGEVKDFLIPPKKPETSHPNAQILRELFCVYKCTSQSCFVLTNGSSQYYFDEIHEHHGEPNYINIWVEFHSFWKYYQNKYNDAILDVWDDAVWNGYVHTARIQGVEDTYS